jgi:protein tyrosine phosphatase (PTP) superfamily phosphohydrolase (DUF442 family)
MYSVLVRFEFWFFVRRTNRDDFMKSVPVVALLLTLLFVDFGSPSISESAESQDSISKRPVNVVTKTNVGPPGLDNLMQVSDRIYSGSEPQGEDGFRSLADLGVKTVVSVDGATPNLVLAHKHGLRYVHIPIGYDGIPDLAGRALARLVRDADSPFYIHCHHGRHRGPAAAAVACIASGEVGGREALKIVERAGTSRDYVGLWRDVEAYKPPASDADLPLLVEVADIGSFAAAMAKIDRSYDNLKLCREASWGVPDDHPDLVPARVTLILREELHEAGRNLAEKYDDQFRAWLSEAETLARHIEEALKSDRPADAGVHFDQLRESCKRCHRKVRN